MYSGNAASYSFVLSNERPCVNLHANVLALVTGGLHIANQLLSRVSANLKRGCRILRENAS